MKPFAKAINAYYYVNSAEEKIGRASCRERV